MIPMTKDHKIFHIIDGVKYLFRPPIEEFEITLQDYLNDDGEIKEIKAMYPVVVKELETEYKGKRKPKKKEWEDLIKERIEKKINKKSKIKEDIIKTNNLIDIVLIGWESEREGVPEFPKEKPSQMLTLPLKNRLITWYWEQYSLEESELKNS